MCSRGGAYICCACHNSLHQKLKSQNQQVGVHYYCYYSIPRFRCRILSLSAIYINAILNKKKFILNSRAKSSLFQISKLSIKEKNKNFPCAQ